MTPFPDDLERQLHAAARAQTAVAQDAAPGERGRRGRRAGAPGRGGPGRRWLRTGLHAAPIAAAVGVTLAVAVVALLTLGHAPRARDSRLAAAGSGAKGLSLPALLAREHPHLGQEMGYIDRSAQGVMSSALCRTQYPLHASTTTATPGAALLSTLGVLRRAATPADRLSAQQRTEAIGQLTGVYVRFIRRVRVLDGVSYWIVPMHGMSVGTVPSAACLQAEQTALRRELTRIPARLRAGTAALAGSLFALAKRESRPTDAICFVTLSRGSSGSSCGETPAAIASGNDAPQDDGNVISDVVPSGVTTVTLHYAAADRQLALTVTGTVVGNVFAVRIAHLAPARQPDRVIWRSSRGSVIKTMQATAGEEAAYCERNLALCAGVMYAVSSSSTVQTGSARSTAVTSSSASVAPQPAK